MRLYACRAPQRTSKNFHSAPLRSMVEPSMRPASGQGASRRLNNPDCRAPPGGNGARLARRAATTDAAPSRGGRRWRTPPLAARRARAQRAQQPWWAGMRRRRRRRPPPRSPQSESPAAARAPVSSCSIPAVRFVSCARRGWAVENYLRRARLEGRLAWEGLEGLKLLHRRHALIWLPRTRLQVHARAADE